MPFDGTESPVLGLAEKVDKVSDLLKTPGTWCKGVLKTRNGQYCIRGALLEADAFDQLQPFVIAAIRDVTGCRVRGVEHFNDSPNTDHEAVLKVLERTRERVLKHLSRSQSKSYFDRLRLAFGALRMKSSFG